MIAQARVSFHNFLNRLGLLRKPTPPFIGPRIGIGHLVTTDGNPEVQVILKRTAKEKGCMVEELQWKRDKHGNIHVRKRCDSLKK